MLEQGCQRYDPWSPIIQPLVLPLGPVDPHTECGIRAQAMHWTVPALAGSKLALHTATWACHMEAAPGHVTCSAYTVTHAACGGTMWMLHVGCSLDQFCRPGHGWAGVSTASAGSGKGSVEGLCGASPATPIWPTGPEEFNTSVLENAE